MNFASVADESFLDHCVSNSDDDVSFVILTSSPSQSLVGRGQRVPAVSSGMACLALLLVQHLLV